MIFKSNKGAAKQGAGTSERTEPSSKSRAVLAAKGGKSAEPVVWTSLDKVQISGHFQLNEDGELVIGGNVLGNIKCNALTVSNGGSMTGDISADVVLISGACSGKIEAGRLTMTETAKVKSEDAVVRETVVIQEGADFEGSLRRQRPGEARKPANGAETAESTEAPAAANQTGGASGTPKAGTVAGR